MFHDPQVLREAGKQMMSKEQMRIVFLLNNLSSQEESAESILKLP